MASLYGLENHGLTNLRRVYWNLPARRALRGGDPPLRGAARRERAVRGRTPASTPRAPPPTSSWCARQTTEDAVWWGQYNRPFNPESFSALHARLCGYLQGRDVFVQDVYGGADPEHRLRRPHRHAEGVAQPLRAHDVPEEPRRSRRRAGTCPTSRSSPRPASRRSRWPTGRAPRRSSSSTSAQKLGDHRRHRLRGRDQEDRLHRPQLPAAARGRALDALLGERGQGRRRRDLLRPLRHRQDDALAPTPRAASSATTSTAGATTGVFNFEDGCYAKVIRLSPEAEPQIYATTRRFGTILENVVYDPVSRAPRPQRREAHREHPRRLPARLHRERGARQARRPPEERRLPDLRRERRHAAHLAARPRTRRSTTSSRATRARSPAPRSASASSRRSRSAPASAGRSWSTTPTSTPSC